MNLYYIKESHVNLKLTELRKIKSYEDLSFGDLIVLELSNRIILTIYNNLNIKDITPLDFNLVTQVKRPNEWNSLNPILFKKEIDCKLIFCNFQINELIQLFQTQFKNSLAQEILNEIICIGNRTCFHRNTALTLKLIKCKDKISLPTDNKYNDIATISSSTVRKLVFVEHYMNSKLKSRYYYHREMLESESRALFNVKREFKSEYMEAYARFRLRHDDLLLSE